MSGTRSKVRSAVLLLGLVISHATPALADCTPSTSYGFACFELWCCGDICQYYQVVQGEAHGIAVGLRGSLSVVNQWMSDNEPACP